MVALLPPVSAMASSWHSAAILESAMIVHPVRLWAAIMPATAQRHRTMA
jgi:hypothetical protein